MVSIYEAMLHCVERALKGHCPAHDGSGPLGQKFSLSRRGRVSVRSFYFFQNMSSAEKEYNDMTPEERAVHDKAAREKEEAEQAQLPYK